MKTAIQQLLRQVALFEWPLQVVSLILTEKESAPRSCAHTLFHEDFLDASCLSLAISKALGLTMTVFSCLYKLPILLNILNAKTGQGLNLSSLYLETSAYVALLIYNVYRGNPLSTYGDFFASSFQNFLIICLIWYYGTDAGKSPTNRHKLIFFISLSIFLCIMITLINGPVIILYRAFDLQVLPIYGAFVIMMARIPQIRANFLSKASGVQSSITLANAVLGSTAKVYINYRESKDPLLVGGAFITSCLNLILLVQVILLKSYESKMNKQVTNIVNPIEVQIPNTHRNLRKKIKKQD